MKPSFFQVVCRNAFSSPWFEKAFLWGNKIGKKGMWAMLLREGKYGETSLCCRMRGIEMFFGPYLVVISKPKRLTVHQLKNKDEMKKGNPSQNQKSCTADTQANKICSAWAFAQPHQNSEINLTIDK